MYQHLFINFDKYTIIMEHFNSRRNCVRYVGNLGTIFIHFPYIFIYYKIEHIFFKK